MAQVPRAECDAIKSDGTIVRVEPGVGVKLTSGTTYYFLMSASDGPTEGVHFLWDSAIVLTSLVFEDCNLPRYKQPGKPDSGDDATDVSTVKGQWIAENPTTNVYISVTSSDGTTGGATVTASTIAVAGGTGGGAMYHLGNLGSRRGRFHVVVGATGGVLRCAPWGKDA